MKKKIKLIAAICIVILAMSIVQLVEHNIQAEADDSIKIDIKVGFEKLYKIGHTTPVYLEINNKFRDINGELQIEIPNQNESISLYAINASLPKYSTKKFKMNVPMNVFNTKLKVNIAEGKNIVSTSTFRIDPGTNAETFIIGILSDNFDRVKYVNKITVPNLSHFSTKNVRLHEDSFPEDAHVLKAFNVILINDFDTSKLSNVQYEALKRWITEGGTLLIGTGPSQNKTLSLFKDDFITGEIGEIQMVQTAALHKMAGSKTVEAFNLSVSDIDMKDSVPVLEDSGYTLLQKIEKGKGVVGVASFDFGMEPLSTWSGSSTFADRAITAILPEQYISDIYQKGMRSYDNAYAIDNALRNIPELPLPKTSNMLILYIGYILLAAPVSYFILRRMDKRELMWVTVPILSVVFSGAVYFSGAGTRLTEPITNVISLIDIDNSGTIIPKTYAGVFSPVKDSVRIEAGEGHDIRPLMVNSGYYGRPVMNEDAPKRIDSKITVSPKTVLEFYKTGIWSMRTLSIESEAVMTGKLESSINYAKGAFSGKIRNTSGFDLDECYIITPNQYASVGPIKNGETKQIDIKPSSYFGHRYELINAIYKDNLSSPQAANQRKLNADDMVKLRANMQKRQVMEYGFMNESYQGFEAKLAAWSSTHISKDIKVNGKTTKKYEKSFITSNVSLSFRDGDSVEYPLGFLKPAIINSISAGNYDELSRMFYGKGSFEVHYAIDGNIIPESISTQYTIGNPQRVRQYIWDVQKGDWVEGDYRSFNIQGDLLDRYVDGRNTLKIKIEMDDDNVQLPLISLKGSVK